MAAALLAAVVGLAGCASDGTDAGARSTGALDRLEADLAGTAAEHDGEPPARARGVVLEDAGQLWPRMTAAAALAAAREADPDFGDGSKVSFGLVTDTNYGTGSLGAGGTVGDPVIDRRAAWVVTRPLRASGAHAAGEAAAIIDDTTGQFVRAVYTR